MSNHVLVFEMAPRDGLQNEKRLIATADKIRLVDMLSACGFAKIEVTSFVSPKWVPQMADAAEVMAGMRRNPAVHYEVLTPNLKGYEAARAARADEVAIFASASEGFSKANINCTIAESLERFRPLTEQARRDGIPVRGYVSCITDCPYDGPTPPGKAAEVSKALIDMGCYEVSLGDTIGVGTPLKARAMLKAVASEVPMAALAVHFHDTYGQALANLLACLEEGVRVADSAVSGTGGCPYAKGASGNVATEDVVYLLHGMGMRTGVDLEQLSDTGRWLAALLGRESGSKVTRARTLV